MAVRELRHVRAVAEARHGPDADEPDLFVELDGVLGRVEHGVRVAVVRGAVRQRLVQQAAPAAQRAEHGDLGELRPDADGVAVLLVARLARVAGARRLQGARDGARVVHLAQRPGLHRRPVAAGGAVGDLGGRRVPRRPRGAAPRDALVRQDVERAGERGRVRRRPAQRLGEGAEVADEHEALHAPPLAALARDVALGRRGGEDDALRDVVRREGRLQDLLPGLQEPLCGLEADGDHLRHEYAPLVVADDALDGRARSEVRVRGARARDAGHVVGRVLVDGRVRRAVRVAAVRDRRRALLGPVVGVAAVLARAVSGEGAGLDLRRLALRAVVGDAHFCSLARVFFTRSAKRNAKDLANALETAFLARLAMRVRASAPAATRRPLLCPRAILPLRARTG